MAAWWWGLDNEYPGWPLNEDEAEEVRFTIEVDGAVAGLIQYIEENEPQYRFAAIDIFVGTEFHGRGIGSEAVRVLARHLFEDRGHHRITIDPNAENAAAIRSYEKVGFKRIGIGRNAEKHPVRGEWSDALLMDLLADDLA